MLKKICVPVYVLHVFELCTLPTTSLSAAVSEWLRSMTRNQMGSARTGSNPVRSVLFLMLEPKTGILQ